MNDARLRQQQQQQELLLPAQRGVNEDLGAPVQQSALEIEPCPSVGEDDSEAASQALLLDPAPPFSPEPPYPFLPPFSAEAFAVSSALTDTWQRNSERPSMLELLLQLLQQLSTDPNSELYRHLVTNHVLPVSNPDLPAPPQAAAAAARTIVPAAEAAASSSDGGEEDRASRAAAAAAVASIPGVYVHPPEDSRLPEGVDLCPTQEPPEQQQLQQVLQQLALAAAAAFEVLDLPPPAKQTIAATTAAAAAAAAGPPMCAAAGAALGFAKDTRRQQQQTAATDVDDAVRFGRANGAVCSSSSSSKKGGEGSSSGNSIYSKATAPGFPPFRSYAEVYRQWKVFQQQLLPAVTSTEQVKGYGTRLMSQLKEFVKKSGIEYFLTYADNFAVGYFRKQGFTSRISLPRDRWLGYIKDYDGGTLMECRISHKINYLRLSALLEKQRAAAEACIESSTPRVVMPGLDVWRKDPSRVLLPSEVPGLVAAGYREPTASAGAFNGGKGAATGGSAAGGNAASAAAAKKQQEEEKQRRCLKNQIAALLSLLDRHPSSWPFRRPVSVSEAPDYYEVVKHPVDISSMRRKNKNGGYRTKQELGSDIVRMFENCRQYNSSDTIYYKYADELQQFIWPKYEALPGP